MARVAWYKFIIIRSPMTSLDAETDFKPIIIIITIIIGFISNCLDFTKAIKIDAMPDTLKHKIVASAVRSSFGIYCNTNIAALDTA